jgi:uncharacterized protein YndB with AHSA1/START domain
MSESTRAADEHAIVEEIEIAIPAERVFDALISARDLAQWWTEPGVCDAVEWRVDARVGGDWISRWRWSDGREFAIGGTILELARPARLVYDWWDDRYPNRPRTVVRYDLTPTASGTHVRLTHSGFDLARTARAEYVNGWRSVLEKLNRYIGGTARGSRGAHEHRA